MEPKKGRIHRLAQHIVSRRAMARGVVVLDEDLCGLEPALTDANIMVVKPPPGMDGEEIRESLLSHRVIVTKNPAAFIDDAPVYEYGVIALNKLKAIDSAASYRKNKTVRLLSKAMSQYKLWAKGAKFLLELREDGRHRLEELC